MTISPQISLPEATLSPELGPPTTRLPRDLRRQQLVASAARVFASQGYHASTMDQVAAVAQVTKPVLYQHFTGKRDLYLQVLDAELELLVEQLVAPLYEARTNKERVRGVISAFFTFARTNVAGYRLIFESDIRHDYAVQERVEQVHAQVAQQIAQILAPNAGMPYQQALMTARMLSGMVLSATSSLLATSEPTAQQVEQAERLAFRLAWGGISIIDEDWE